MKKIKAWECKICGAKVSLSEKFCPMINRVGHVWFGEGKRPQKIKKYETL
jgi:hypothetical protein